MWHTVRNYITTLQHFAKMFIIKLDEFFPVPREQLTQLTAGLQSMSCSQKTKVSREKLIRHRKDQKDVPKTEDIQKYLLSKERDFAFKILEMMNQCKTQHPFKASELQFVIGYFAFELCFDNANRTGDNTERGT